jgi:hypothetical protein
MDVAIGGAIGGVFGLLIVVVFGLAVGVVAKLLMPGTTPEDGSSRSCSVSRARGPADS